MEHRPVVFEVEEIHVSSPQSKDSSVTADSLCVLNFWLRLVLACIFLKFRMLPGNTLVKPARSGR